MDKLYLIDYCLSLDLAYLDFPFIGDNYTVVKIKNIQTGKYKIFAEIFELNGVEMLTFSADKETTIHLRNQFSDSIKKGWHCPPLQAQYKSSVAISNMPDELIKHFVDLSYAYVCQKLKLN